MRSPQRGYVCFQGDDLVGTVRKDSPILLNPDEVSVTAAKPAWERFSGEDSHVIARVVSNGRLRPDPAQGRTLNG
jgi:hypothetical protein